MINWIIGAGVELAGYRKKTAQDKPDKRDFKAEEHVKVENPPPKGIFLWNGYAQDQGYSNRCTGFSGGHNVSIILTIMGREIHTIEGDDVWDLQVKNGTASEEKGDYVQSTAKAIVKSGITDKRGKEYKFEKYLKVERKDFKKYLSSGYPILTGAHTHRVMCDMGWYWKPGSNTGGHAFTLVGYDDKEGCYFGINSWGRWGIKKTGLFKIKYGNERYLFSPYILEGLRAL